MIPGKGQFRPRFPLSAQLRFSDNLFLDPATDTDIISSATLLDGRAGNDRRSLEFVIDYALQQKIIPRKFTVDELFDDTTRILGL